MPTVPYSAVPTVEQAGPPGAFLTSNGDTGAQQIGQALQRGASVVQQAADRKEDTDIKTLTLTADADAKMADVKFGQAIADKSAEFYQMQGKAAMDARPDFVKFMNDAAKEATSGLNPYASKLAMQSIARRMDMIGQNVATHTAQQMKTYTNQASVARTSLSVDQAGSAPDEPQFQTYLNTAKSEVDGRVAKGEIPPEQGDVEKQKIVDEAYSRRISGVALTDPSTAHKMLEDNGALLSPVQRDRLTREVRTSEAQIGARTIGDQVLRGTGGMDSFVDKLVGKEYGNGAVFKNPRSSASGAGQFIDATWDMLRQTHPELGLTADGRKDPAQSRAAVAAYAQDNAEILKNNGYDVNEKNLYLAHFMGPGGAVSILNAAKVNPNADASKLFPSQADANPSVFNGKTVQQVVDNQTSKFSDQKVGQGMIEKGLNPASTQEEINKAAEKARQMAIEQFPSNVQAADAAEQYVRSKAVSLKAASTDAQRQNFSKVMTSVIGTPGQPRPTTLDELIGTNDDMRKAVLNLDPNTSAYNTILRGLQANAERNKKDVPVTAEGIARFKELRGMAITDPEAFTNGKVSLANEPLLSNAMQHQLVQEVSKPRKEEDDVQLTSAIGKLKTLNVLKNLGIDEKKNPKAYNQFVGEVQDRLAQARALNKTLDDNDFRQMGLDMAKQKVKDPGLFWDGEKPALKDRDPVTGYDKQLPGPVVEEVTKAFARANGGRAPTKDEAIAVYKKYKTVLDKKYGLN